MRYPSIDITKVTVTISSYGMARGELEAQVTGPVETALVAIAGIRHLTSTVLDGQSSTVAEFRLDVNAEQALSDVTDAIAKIRGTLPATIGQPIIQRNTVQGEAIVT